MLHVNTSSTTGGCPESSVVLSEGGAPSGCEVDTPRLWLRSTAAVSVLTMCGWLAIDHSTTRLQSHGNTASHVKLVGFTMPRSSMSKHEVSSVYW